MLIRTLALAAVVLAAGPLAAADPAPPAGRWKLRVPEGDDALTLLVHLSQADGKWAGEFVSASGRLRQPPAFTRLEVDGRAVRFALAVAGQEFAAFDGLLAADGKKVSGSLSVLGGPLQLAELYPSRLRKADDAADLAREDAEQLDPGPALFRAAFLALGQAGAKTVPPDEVARLADRAGRAAATYGGRWEGVTALKLAGLLADQKPYAGTAAVHARRARDLLPASATPGERLAVLGVLARALANADKPDEAAKVLAEANKLEAEEYAAHQKAGIPADKFAGRKTKSDRVAVVEAFTGAECSPCVPVDLALDALLRAYGPGEVILLNYHVHAPGLDPLAAPDGQDRAAAYGDRAAGAPAVFVNGRPVSRGVGAGETAATKHRDVRARVDAGLDTPAGAAVTLSAAPAPGGTFTATASVRLPAAGAGKVSLRFALAEELVRYPGGNGVKFHARVVRAMPGGAKGFPVAGTTLDRTVTVDPAAVRARLLAYLSDTAKAEGDFPRPDRPVDLKDLSVVAFVQDDATGEILQAAQVALTPGK